MKIFLFMDAMGWEIIRKYGFLNDELPVRYPVRMQFGYSSTAIPTILSGEYPRVHQHLSFYYYDKENSPFKGFRYLSFLPGCIFDRGRVRGRLSRLFAKWKRYSGYFQLYSVPFRKLPYLDYCEKQDIFARNGLAPVKNLRDILEEREIRYHISDWHLDEMENIDRAERALCGGEVDFAFIYTAGFDAFMHDNVSRESVVASRLEMYTKRIKTFLNHLTETGKAFSFTIFSDHGMTPLSGVVPLMRYIDELGLRFGADYVSVYDSTMARFWYFNETAKYKIRERLNRTDCRGSFVSQEEKEKYGIDFSDSKFGEDIFLMEAGVQIVPSDMGRTALNGMHGFSPEDKDSFAAYLSTQEPPFVPLEVKDYFHIMKQSIQSIHG